MYRPVVLTLSQVTIDPSHRTTIAVHVLPHLDALPRIRTAALAIVSMAHEAEATPETTVKTAAVHTRAVSAVAVAIPKTTVPRRAAAR